MGDIKGFLKVKRREAGYRPKEERVRDYYEVSLKKDEETNSLQASRCMDCGTPFCHWACPLGNYIPEWNDYLFHKDWKMAFELLDVTNNLPEVTGRLCPALCEYACVLGINDDPVTIRENELSIIEYAFKNGLIKPVVPKIRTGKKIAIIGSGPAGISAAQQLNKSGHSVTVFERDKKIGGIMRYGIPDFKLGKWVLDRRINLLEGEGIKFKTGIEVGSDFSISEMEKEFDALVIAIGSKEPRDLKIKGRELKGIYFAMDYLKQNNRRVSGEKISEEELIDAKGKKVVIIGGGDTGSDCVGTANRQGADYVTQIEVMPKPPEARTINYPWPLYPLLLKTSSSHQEGVRREWSVLTKEFSGKDGKLTKLKCARVEFKHNVGGGRPVMYEIPGSEFEIEADLAILAVGFVHPEHKGLVEKIGVDLDNRGNIKTDSSFMTSKRGIFSAGDAHRGQSLIVWAIYEGRRVASYVNTYLMGNSKP